MEHKPNPQLMAMFKELSASIEEDVKHQERQEMYDRIIYYMWMMWSASTLAFSIGTIMLIAKIITSPVWVVLIGLLGVTASGVAMIVMIFSKLSARRGKK